MRYRGSCHCSNITFELEWPERMALAPRKCGCSYCSMHNSSYVGHPDASVKFTIRDQESVREYRFGTRAVRFSFCAQCGVMVFAMSDLDGRNHAVVNANTLEVNCHGTAEPVTKDYGGESPQERRERRKHTWIPTVSFASAP